MAINLVIEACGYVGIVACQCGVVNEASYVVLIASGNQKERGNKRESQMNQVCFMLCTLTVRLSFYLRFENKTQVAAVI
jgi:hypothetical protein